MNGQNKELSRSASDLDHEWRGQFTHEHLSRMGGWYWIYLARGFGIRMTGASPGYQRAGSVRGLRAGCPAPISPLSCRSTAPL